MKFRTLSDAKAAGWRVARHVSEAVDTSSQDPANPTARSVGYSYKLPNGNESVTVHLTDERNAGGTFGTYVEMFPPPYVVAAHTMTIGRNGPDYTRVWRDRAGDLLHEEPISHEHAEEMYESGLPMDDGGLIQIRPADPYRPGW